MCVATHNGYVLGLVGPVVALAFASTIDDPHRFVRASDVGAYLGLTPRLSVRRARPKRPHLQTRRSAYVLVTVVRRPSPLESWAAKLVKRIGPQKAKVAAARTLAVILHCIWTDGTEFDWGKAVA
jgi:transposase